MAYACVGKLSGSISIAASPTTITVGESTTISGSITPASVGETVIIWHRQIGKPWGILATVTTNDTSHYSYIWTALAWGTYELKATWIGDTYAAESSITTVDVKAPPAASFTYLPHTPTIGENITFDASASSDLDGTIESYAWDFDDGTTGTGVTTTHAYTTADTYDITLTITDNDTLTDTETKSITVSLQLQPPIASFIHSPTAPQVNEIVTFDASASSDPDGTIVSYEWVFGDGTNGTSKIATHTYADNRTYVVTLNVTDNHGLSNVTSKDILVLDAHPNATFTESAENVYTYEVITFNASGSYDPDGNITSYFWDFGDETNATSIIVEHSYADDGNYTVTLTVTDDDGATNNATATKTVLNRSPVASFTESAEIVYPNEAIYFNATGSYDPDGNITSYFWDFGDETNATGVTTEHSYPLEGNYTVTLTVTDDDNATGKATAIKEALNRPPVAIFSESTETAYIGEAITFNASDSYDLDGTIVNYFWEFGDGTNTTGVIVNHAYDINGTVNVTLTVTDDDGASNSSASTKTILKNEPPVPLFTESAENVNTGEVITFNASGSYDPDGNITSYFWDFGDGTSTTGVTVDHAYVDAGAYTATLVVTDDDGKTASKSAVKTISNRPPIALSIDDATNADVDELIRFDASGSYDLDGSILSYFWDFGDGNNATMCVIVDHAYAADGNYTVTLTVTDDDGASSSVSSTIIVKGSLGWPLYLVTGIALGIAGLTGTAIYAIFRRKKKKTKEQTPTLTKEVKEQTPIPTEEVKEATDLEKTCAGDKESYEALRESMFLDPRKADVSMKDSVEKAKSFEKQGKNVEAKAWYEIAGGLAIYEGDVAKVKEYFSKCKELSPNSAYPILGIPKKAVNKAQEYYLKYLKEETR